MSALPSNGLPRAINCQHYSCASPFFFFFSFIKKGSWATTQQHDESLQMDGVRDYMCGYVHALAQIEEMVIPLMQSDLRHARHARPHMQGEVQQLPHAATLHPFTEGNNHTRSNVRKFTAWGTIDPVAARWLRGCSGM